MLKKSNTHSILEKLSQSQLCEISLGLHDLGSVPASPVSVSPLPHECLAPDHCSFSLSLKSVSDSVIPSVNEYVAGREERLRV